MAGYKPWNVALKTTSTPVIKSFDTPNDKESTPAPHDEWDLLDEESPSLALLTKII